MKIILSRKGFDSVYGGQPSPILPDGTLLSLPIPVKNDNNKFSNLMYKGKSYYDIIKELKPKSKIAKDYDCHLDPDIRNDAKEREVNWKGLFGQSDAAQGHLLNQNVGKNDLFLFFGWFRETEYENKVLRYKKGAHDLHVIFAYLQVGKIYSSMQEVLPLYVQNHPHAQMFQKRSNNCIYETSDFLSFDKTKRGYGTLKYANDLVLTKKGKTRSRWQLPDFFRNINISYHSSKSFKQDYFDSAKIGQEFVLEGGKELLNWTKNIISHN